MSTQLHAIATELAKRPADEHFGSFPEALHYTQTVRDQSSEHTAKAAAVEFEPGTEPGVLFTVGLPGLRGLRPTAYFGETLANALQTTTTFLAGLKPATLATALRESWARLHTPEKELLFLTRPCVEGGREIRCMTTARYGRIWDADLLEDVERWLLGSRYVAAIPTINTSYAKKNQDGTLKPALFAGDRSSHFFFYTDQKPKDDLGGLRRGFLLSNSEIGARSLRWSTFYFRDLCANFIIWNASAVEQRKVRHMSDAILEARRDLFRTMQQLGDEVEPLVYDTISRAQHEPFVPEGGGASNRRERAVKRLRDGFRLTKERAEAAIFAAAMPENQAKDNPWSVFSVAQGVTYIAKREERADDMVELASVGGRILQLAGIG